MEKQQTIRIRLKSYDYRMLDKATMEIVDTVKRTGSRLAGPIPLPTRIEKFSVNRSPHVNKKSAEQFEIRTHKRIIDVYKPSDNTLDNLRNLDISAGVDVEVKNF